MPTDTSFFCVGSALRVRVSEFKIRVLTLLLFLVLTGTHGARSILGTVSKSVEDGELRNAQGFEAQIGVHVDYIPNKHVILRTGYRFGTSLGETDEPFKEHRLVTEQTLRQMPPGDLLLSDRNREDFRFVNGDFSFRYRNRVTIERELHLLKRRTVTPYVSGEMFYDTRYNIWNRNRLAVGIQTSLRRGPIRKLLLPKRQIIWISTTCGKTTAALKYNT